VELEARGRRFIQINVLRDFSRTCHLVGPLAAPALLPDVPQPSGTRKSRWLFSISVPSQAQRASGRSTKSVGGEANIISKSWATPDEIDGFRSGALSQRAGREGQARCRAKRKPAPIRSHVACRGPAVHQALLKHWLASK